jgi:hypothetical protein
LGAAFGGAFGSASGAGAAWATTNDASLSSACETGAVNCATLSVVVANSKRRSLVMVSLNPPEKFSTKLLAERGNAMN